MKKSWLKRVICGILTGVMVLSYIPTPISAAQTDGLCEHHTQHTEECGYSSAVEGMACNHEHTDACYETATACIHVHGDCGYVEAVTEVPCSHVCSEENGCVTKILKCQHQHDATCSYEESAAETSCRFVCDICTREQERTAADRVAAVSVETDAPIIKSVSLDKSHVAAGESVTVTMNVTDESDLKQVYVTFDTPNEGVANMIRVDLSRGTDGLYRGTLRTDDTFTCGTYHAYYIVAQDIHGNREQINRDESVCFELVSVQSETNAPVINSVSVDKKQIFVGESVTVTMDVSDESELAQVYVKFETPFAGVAKMIDVPLSKSEDGLYRGTLTTDDTFACGIYYAYYIVAQDVYGNRKQISGDTTVCFELISHSGVETNPPVIKSITLDKNEVTAGETVSVTVDVTDESELSDVRLYFNTPVSGSSTLEIRVKMVLGEDGLYRGTLSTNESFANGNYYVSACVAEDVYGNYTQIQNKSVCFELSGGHSETNPPVINSITLDKNRVTAGETVTVTVDVTDESELSNVRLYFNTPVSGSSTLEIRVKMVLGEDGLYRGTLSTDKSFASGNYYVSACVAEDVYGNYTQVQDKSVCFELGSKILETNAPVINSVSVDKAEVLAGETVTVTMDVTDESELNQVYVTFDTPHAGVAVMHRIDLTKGSDGLYRGTLTTDDTYPYGTYYAYYIVAQDILSNRTQINRDTSVCFELVCSLEDHSWDEGNITKESTEEEPGLRTYTCTVCGKIKTEEIPALCHTHEFGDDGTCECGAVGGICGENLTWCYVPDDKMLTISGIGTMWDMEVLKTPWNAYTKQITQIIVEKGVKSIGDDAFWGCSAVTNIVLPENLLSIGENSFLGCGSLQVIELPDTLTSIGEQAFFQCFDLEEVYIPASVTQIGDIPFGLCESLTSITVDPANQYYCSDENGFLFSKDKTVLYQVLTSISGSYTVPDCVTTINRLAFDSCNGLTELIIPDSVTEIGHAAFGDCRGLKKIRLPSNLKRIEWGLFIRCLSLESVTIPAGVKSFNNQVFAQIDYFDGVLSEIIFEGSAPDFPEFALEGATVTAYYPVYDTTWIDVIKHNYGGNITWVPYGSNGICGERLTWAFNQITNTLTISGMGDMYDYSQDSTNPAPWTSFSGDIKKLVLEEGVTGIGDFAFVSCSEIESGTFPSTLTRVGKYPFYRFSRPNGNVYYQVFWSEVNQTVRQWSQIQFEGDSERFLGGDSTNFVCHSPIIASGKYGDRVYWELNENGTMEFFGSGDMEEFWATGSWLYDEYAKTIVITEGITNIGMNAFEAYSPDPLSVTLESVRIASTVKRVEEMAFAGCQVLKNITFVGDAPTFGANCFRKVTATAYYPAGNATWTEAVMQDYEGDITWVPYCQEHSFGEWIVEGTNSHRTCIHCGYTEHKVVTDSGDVEIEIPEQPDLEVEVDPVLPSEDNYVLVEEALDSTGNQNQAILKVFDINLKNSEGVHVQPSGTVKVKIPLDWSKNGNYKVYRVNDDGTLTDMNAYQQGSHMVFETDHFSLYVIVEESEDTPDIVASGSCGENLKYALTSDGTLTVTGSGAMYDYDGSSSAPWYNLRQSVVSIVLSRGVTSIGSEAFHDCSSLISVTIPNGITSIGKEAFSCCSKLSSVSIPSGVSTISAHCFYSCTKLASVSIPEGVTQIEDGAFENCSDLTTISLPNSVTSIGSSAFSDCCRLTKITIPSGVTTIGSGAFRACSQLTEITLPSGISTIGENTFSSCSRLGSIVIPNGVTSIGNDAFRWCVGLKSVTIPNSVVTIGSDAFDNCLSLTSITIPGNVTSIGESAFYDSALTEIHFLGDGFQGKSNLFSSPVVAYYSAKNATWTQEIRDSFGTKVTWRDSSENYLVLNDSELIKETQVWIDGVSYPVKKDSAGAYVNIPASVPPVLVTYSYNSSSGDRHTQYPTGMQAYRIHQTETAATVERLPELDNLLQYSGSSIRITGNKGIRMITSVNQDNRNMLTGNGLAGFKLLEYGTLLAQTSKLGDNPLVLGGANVKSNYAYKKGVADPVFKYADGLIQYTNVLIGFTDEQCKEDIAMRPYMKLQDENGEEFVIYGGIVYRSIGYIAYQNRKAFQPGSAAYEYVWSIIHNVYGTKYDSEYRK